jgi:hypothetical protein
MKKVKGVRQGLNLSSLMGVFNEINYTDVTGRPPLQPNEIRYFKEIVSNKSDEIVAKWIDFFVLHKSIISENITRRPK